GPGDRRSRGRAPRGNHRHEHQLRASMPSLEYSVAAFAVGHRVTVVGEVDLATSPELAEVLAQVANGTVRVDITGVTFLDSSGLRTLLVAHRNAQHAGRRMIVCGEIDPIVQKTLTVTSLDEVLEFDHGPTA